MLIAICDDAPEDLELLVEYARRYDPGLAVRAFPSAKALLAAYPQEKYDIVFMDIEMEPPTVSRLPRGSAGSRTLPVSFLPHRP